LSKQRDGKQNSQNNYCQFFHGSFTYLLLTVYDLAV